MDFELLIALCVLWITTTVALVSFLSMWFMNDGEAFHPHSVAVDHRHRLFLVVSARTECKYDCAVKSISEFAAPRGSSPSKNFAALCVMIAVAGFLGTSRWYAVGDAKPLEAILSFIGFGSVLLVAAFELDVEPERYLDQKLLVTGWLIKKLGLRHHLKFTLQPHDNRFLDFIRQSKGIYHLYSEDRFIKYQYPTTLVWRYHPIWNSLHMLGAIGFVVFVTAAILINDVAEEKVAWITGLSFTTFGLLGYLTGNYLPVIRPFQCWIITWNPFVDDPHFMYKLIEAIRDYVDREGGVIPQNVITENPTVSEIGKIEAKLTRRKSNGVIKKNKDMSSNKKTIPTILPHVLKPDDADEYLDIWPLKMAKKYPKDYLRIIGQILVMVELLALMTPAVAMGIQWITAQCQGPPVYVILDVISILFQCVVYGHCSAMDSHCILK